MSSTTTRTRLVTLTGLTLTLLLAFAAPALAQNPGHGGHEIGSGDDGSETAAVILRVVLLVISGLVAGIALLRPIARVDNSRTRLVVQVGAGLTAAALLLSSATAGVGFGYAVVQAVFTLLIPLLWRRPVPTAVLGALLTLLLAAEAADAHDDTPVAVGMSHSAASTIWLAAAALFLLADERHRALRLLIPVSLGATAVLAVTGVVAADRSNLGFDQATADSGFGRIVAVKALLLVLIVGGGVVFWLRRSADSEPRPLLMRVGTVTLAGALGAGAVLAALDPPLSPAASGRLALASVEVGDDDVRVAVIAHRPGPNLVYVDGEGYSVGTDRDALVAASPRPGATGGWAVIDLPADESTVYIEKDGEDGKLLVDAEGPATTPAALLGATGPECASVWLSARASEDDRPEPAACPADVLSPADAEALRAVVRHLVARRAPAVALISDETPRAAAARAVITEQAGAIGLRVTDDRLDPTAAQLVVSGWEPADAWLRSQAGPNQGVVGFGSYLAPWLAVPGLLRYSTGAVTVLRFDPKAADAQRYLAALRGEALQGQASPAGFAAWIERPALTDEAPNLLYAAAQVSFLPASLGHDHADGEGWLPGGTLTAVSQPLP